MRRCTSSANATTATPPPSAWSTAAIIIAVPPPVIEPPRLAMLIEPTRKPATNTTIPATFHHLYECLRIVSSRMIVTGRRRAAESRLEPPRVARAPNVAWRRVPPAPISAHESLTALHRGVDDATDHLPTDGATWP